MKKTITLLSAILFFLILCLQGYRFYVNEKISVAEVLLERVRTEKEGQTVSESLLYEDEEDIIAALAETISNEGRRFFPTSDDAAFLQEGREITALIKSSGLTIQSYKLKPQEKSVTYQYQLSCEVRQFMKVLEKLRNRKKYLKIVNLSINSSTRPAVISLVLSPVIYPELDFDGTGILESTAEIEESNLPLKEYSPTRITRNVFSIPAAAPIKPVTPPAPVKEAVEPEIPIGPSWLKYVGTSSSDKKKVYYLMDERSNKTMKLSPGESLGSYTLTQVRPDRLYLQIEGETVYVYK